VSLWGCDGYEQSRVSGERALTFKKGNKHGKGWKTGKPARTREQYISHFWARVDKSGSCWLWTAAKNTNGYGVLRIDCHSNNRGRLVFAHRLSYELTKGAIPDGLHLDHLCRTRNCVNPAHLEAVTPRINCLRGIGPSAKAAKKTHCSKGHPFEGQNLYLRPDRHGRQCLICKHNNFKEWSEKNQEKLKAKSLARYQKKMLDRVL
jgi:hypothetical protein